MSDIFISYVEADTADAAALVHVLEAAGWSVWWDGGIPLAPRANERKSEIAEAKVVVVLWSRNSVHNKWLQKEARFAADRQKLLPIVVDDVEVPPFPFQALRIVGWEGSSDTPAFGTLLAAVSNQLGPDVIPADDVYLGVGTPHAVSPGERFVVRFTAYTEPCRAEARRVIEAEAPSSHVRLDLETCRWKRGAKIRVRLEASALNVSNPVRRFSWNGTWRVLRFDVSVRSDMTGQTLALRFQVAVEGLPIAVLQPEIAVLTPATPSRASQASSFIEFRSPRTAFASYARADQLEVLGRIRSLQIFTGIDVLLDCLSIRPGEEWKPRLLSEIAKRDIFWLFWSRAARNSKWVEWEWRTALATKSIAGIQPHPLEPEELAPAPAELASLQFGAMYEWYLSGLRESWVSRSCRRLWRRAMSALGR